MSYIYIYIYVYIYDISSLRVNDKRKGGPQLLGHVWVYSYF